MDNKSSSSLDHEPDLMSDTSQSQFEVLSNNENKTDSRDKSPNFSI